MANEDEESEICRNITSTGLATCDIDESQLGAAISWCVDNKVDNSTSCFYSINCCQYVESSPPAAIEENEPPIQIIETSSRPTTNNNVVTTAGNDEISILIGTSGTNVVENTVTSSGNNVGTFDEQTTHTPSPAPSKSRAGVGIGFAFVVIAIGVVMFWKKGGSDATSNRTNNGQRIISPTRSVTTDHRTRRTSSNRRRSSNGSVDLNRSRSYSNHNGGTARQKKKRTIYDSDDDSLDSDFIVNTRMRTDPVESDSDSQFTVKSI